MRSIKIDEAVNGPSRRPVNARKRKAVQTTRGPVFCKNSYRLTMLNKEEGCIF